MKTNKNTRIVKDVIKLGVSPDNAYRIVNVSTGQAAKTLVKLIKDLHARGVLVVIE